MALLQYLIARGDGQHGGCGASRVVAWLPWLRLLRVFRLGRCLALFHDFLNVHYHGLVRVGKILFAQAFVWHWIACCYWWISWNEGFCYSDEFSYDQLPSVDQCACQNTTRRYDAAFVGGGRAAMCAGVCWWHPGVKAGFERAWAHSVASSEQGGGVETMKNGFFDCIDSWTPWAALKGEKWPTRYLQSLSWAVVATTGVGKDIVPQTDAEVWFTILCIFVGFIFNAVVIGSLSSALGSIDSAKNELNRKLKNVDVQCTYTGVPKYLHDDIRKFYRYKWLSCGEIEDDENNVFSKLPQNMRTRLKVALRAERIMKIPLFAHLSARCIIAIINSMTTEIAIPGEYIIQAGTQGKKGYVLDKGEVQIVLEGTKKDVVEKKGEGWFFGEGAFHAKAVHVPYRDEWGRIVLGAHGQPITHVEYEPDIRSASICAVGYCVLLVLTAERVRELAKLFPRFQQQLDGAKAKNEAMRKEHEKARDAYDARQKSKLKRVLGSQGTAAEQQQWNRLRQAAMQETFRRKSMRAQDPAWKAKAEALRREQAHMERIRTERNRGDGGNGDGDGEDGDGDGDGDGEDGKEEKGDGAEEGKDGKKKGTAKKMGSKKMLPKGMHDVQQRHDSSRSPDAEGDAGEDGDGNGDGGDGDGDGDGDGRPGTALGPAPSSGPVKGLVAAVQAGDLLHRESRAPRVSRVEKFDALELGAHAAAGAGGRGGAAPVHQLFRARSAHAQGARAVAHAPPHHAASAVLTTARSSRTIGGANDKIDIVIAKVQELENQFGGLEHAVSDIRAMLEKLTGTKKSPSPRAARRPSPRGTTPSPRAQAATPVPPRHPPPEA